MASTKRSKTVKVDPEVKRKKKRERTERYVSIWPQGYVVNQERVARAQRILGRYLPRIPENTILDVLAEAGLWDCWIGYNKDGTSLRFDMTDMQCVCFAAAIACVGENMAKADEE